MHREDIVPAITLFLALSALQIQIVDTFCCAGIEIHDSWIQR